MGTENHKAPVIRITELVKHPNADSLSLVYIGGYQVVVRTDQYKVGDLAVYVQPDSIVPELPQFAFVWEKDGAGNTRQIDGPVPANYRRVTVRKFRKQISEGLLIPVAEFANETDVMTDGYAAGYYAEDEQAFHKTWYWNDGRTEIREGDDVATLLGIEHYVPAEDSDTTGDNEPGPRKSKKWPRSLKGWLYLLAYIFTLGLYNPNGATGGLNEGSPDVSAPEYDVENYKNFVGALLPGEEVRGTEKIHGSNARYVYMDGHMYAGSRRLWKSQYALSSIWRKVLATDREIQAWCKFHPGYVLYGEVVPVQKGYDYGHTASDPALYVFDVRTPDGRWLEYGSDEFIELDTCRFLTLHWVPAIYLGPFDEEKVKLAAEGETTTFAKHLREGVVVRPVKEAQGYERGIRGLGRVQLKIVSLKFLEKDNKQ